MINGSLRKEILTSLGSSAYVLFQFYIEYLTEYQEMARDTEVAKQLGWPVSKTKRYRDRLTKSNPNYYEKVMTDYYPG